MGEAADARDTTGPENGAARSRPAGAGEPGGEAGPQRSRATARVPDATPGRTPRKGTGTALSLPRTALGLARYRRRAWRWMGAGVCVPVLGLAVGPSAHEAGLGPVSALAAFSVATGPLALLVGVAALVTSRRMRRALAAGPWVACTAVYAAARSEMPRVVLRPPGGDGLVPLSVRTVSTRYHLAAPEPGGVLWWCGDPRTGGVLARPGGSDPLWAHRTRSARPLRRGLVAAERQGLADRPDPVPSRIPDPAGTVRPEAVDLSYAAVAAAAARMPLTRPSGGRVGKPVTDVTRWWRVRALQEISQARPAAVNALAVLVTSLAWALLPDDMDIAFLPLLAAVFAFNTIRFARAAMIGVPAVKEMARVASAPGSVPMRYVLLPGWEGELVLVLFAADGGPDAPPLAVLEVNPPGPGEDPWSGVPPQTGTADVRGRPEEGHTVVPCVDGHPLWPRHPYENVQPGDARDTAHLTALLTGTDAP